MPRSGTQTKRIQVWVSPETHAEAERIANKKEIGVGVWARMALLDAIEEERKENGQ